MSVTLSFKKILIEKGQCYICGRNKKALDMLMEQFTEQLVEKNGIDAIEKDIQNNKKDMEEYVRSSVLKYKEYFSKILKDTENNENLKFTVKTILTDIDTFRGMIPRLDDLLKFSNNEENTLNDLRESLTNYLLELENPQNLLELLEKIKDDGIISLKEKLKEKVTNRNRMKNIVNQERKVAEKLFQLHKKETFFIVDNKYNVLDPIHFDLGQIKQNLKESGTCISINVDFLDKMGQPTNLKDASNLILTEYYICEICSKNFKEASHAAYDVIHENDNFDFD